MGLFGDGDDETVGCDDESEDDEHGEDDGDGDDGPEVDATTCAHVLDGDNADDAINSFSPRVCPFEGVSLGLASAADFLTLTLCAHFFSFDKAPFVKAWVRPDAFFWKAASSFSMVATACGLGFRALLRFLGLR